MPKTKINNEIKFIINPCIFGYANSERDLILEVSSAIPGIKLVNSSLLFSLISLPNEFTKEIALTVWERLEFFNDNELNEIWFLLSNEKIILPKENEDLSLKRYKIWNANNWSEAYIFHEGTRDYPFLDMSKPDSFKLDANRMTGYSSTDIEPPHYLDVKNDIKYQLLDISNLDVISFINESDDYLKKLSFLLKYPFGIKKVNNNHVKKFVPSGGSRHPVEAFVFIKGISNLKNGVYNYNSKTNQIIWVNDFNQDHWSDATYNIFNLDRHEAYIGICYTLFFPRSMWRYRDPRSSRAPFIDIGHCANLLNLLCHELGYKCTTSQNFKDEKISNILKLNSITEVVSYISLIEI